MTVEFEERGQPLYIVNVDMYPGVLERITLTTFGGNQQIARNEKREGLVMWESLHKLWAALLFVAPCCGPMG